MRYSQADLRSDNKLLAEVHPNLGLRKMDARVGGYWIVKYEVGTSGRYNNVSGVLYSRAEVDAWISGLQHGAELRETAIRTAITKAFQDPDNSQQRLVAILSTWILPL